MGKKNEPNAEMVKGTLDMMVLRTLVTGDAHGHTIAKVIERTSEDVLEVEHELQHIVRVEVDAGARNILHAAEYNVALD